jgi:ABC-2 type transport system permease protein
MNSTFAEAAGDTPRTAPAPAVRPPGAALLTLVRREFWEHASLWRVPLVAAALLALCAIPAHVDLDAEDWARLAPNRVAIFTATQLLCVPLYLIMTVMLSFYLLDCLYAERRDRSVLFWKSMPVSDALTVLSKFLVAVAVVPLGVFGLAMLSNLLFVGIWELRVAAGNAPAIISWDTLAWMRTEIALLVCLILGTLWYAPLVAALLAVSAWVRRSPVMWVTLAPLLAIILERIAFGSHHVWSFLQYRTLGIWRLLGEGDEPIVRGHHLRGLDSLLGSLNFGAALRSPGLWLGLLAAAALLFVTIRIRRYRDDT